MTKRESACTSNLKQVGAAAILYSRDHGGHLPDASKWEDKLDPYVRNPGLFDCPARRGPGRHGYAFNRRVSGMRLSSIQDPKQTPLIFDSSAERRNAAEDPAQATPHSTTDHAMAAFADGHVARLQTSDTRGQ
jgi:prepilin-type processing-associated H-X9-DG protein